MATISNSATAPGNQAERLNPLTAGNAATASADASAPSPSSATASSQTQDRFLQLLVAQMKNQDPLNPLDNAQVTTQMAQISTVEGVEKLNSTMARFAESSGMSRAANATGLVGQTVLAPGSRLTWGTETRALGSGVTLDKAASRVAVELLDATGKIVDRRTFTDPAAGTIGLEWTGRNADGGTYGAGNYTMRATVMADNGATATTLTTDTVAGVTDSADGVMALLAGGQQIAVSSISGVFQPQPQGNPARSTR